MLGAVGAPYDEAAQQYDTAYRERTDRMQDELARSLLRRHHLWGGRILDVGCGTGLTQRLLKPASSSYVGLDLSGPMLSRAKESDPTQTYLRADMHAFPFASSSFDLVSFLFSFSYGTGRLIVREARRVLRPGGRLIVFGAYGPVFDRSRTLQADVPLERWSRRRLVELMGDEGFGVLESFCFGRLDPLFVRRIPRLCLPQGLTRFVAVAAQKQEITAAAQEAEHAA